MNISTTVVAGVTLSVLSFSERGRGQSAGAKSPEPINPEPINPEPINPEQLIADLRGLHLPQDPAWWPPAPGWWIALALVCLAAFLLFRFFGKDNKPAGDWRKSALKQQASLVEHRSIHRWCRAIATHASLSA